jgi:hypothetical protein
VWVWVGGAHAPLSANTCAALRTAARRGGVVAWTAAGLYGKQLIKQLVVMGLPHTGVAALNLSAAQYVRSLYMLSFQVRRVRRGARGGGAGAAACSLWGTFC